RRAGGPPPGRVAWVRARVPVALRALGDRCRGRADRPRRLGAARRRAADRSGRDRAPVRPARSGRRQGDPRARRDRLGADRPAPALARRAGSRARGGRAPRRHRDGRRARRHDRPRDPRRLQGAPRGVAGGLRGAGRPTRGDLRPPVDRCPARRPGLRGAPSPPGARVSFLSPLALLGLLFVPVVLAMYLLKLRRDQQIVPATLLWQRLLTHVEANAPWQRLRRSLLLLLQLLLVALLAILAARPFLERPAGLAGDVVVVIDTSASMGATDLPPTRLSEAKAKVLERLHDLPANGTVSVIAAG